MVFSPSGVGYSSLLFATDAFPWPTAPLDPARLLSYLARCISLGIGYGLGDKAHVLTAPSPDYHAIDCSGWVRAAVAVATQGRTILPDGSVNQNDWCATVGLKRSNFLSTGLHDGIVRINFHRPNGADNIGHVWLTYNGKTLESWGGHGPGSRSWLTHVLKALCTDSYVLGIQK